MPDRLSVNPQADVFGEHRRWAQDDIKRKTTSSQDDIKPGGRIVKSPPRAAQK
jgi:hypothetical protein